MPHLTGGHPNLVQQRTRQLPKLGMFTQRRPTMGRLTQNRPDGRRRQGDETQIWGVTAPPFVTAWAAPSPSYERAARLNTLASAFIIGIMIFPFVAPLGRLEH